MKKDFFQSKASDYEQDKNRVDNVKNIADAIIHKLHFTQSMQIMDFGSGTGLLLEKVAPLVKKVTAIDMSPSMNKKLNEKRDALKCELEILEIDLTKTKLDKSFDAIISSMTLHHIENIKNILTDFYNMLDSGGTIAHKPHGAYPIFLLTGSK